MPICEVGIYNEDGEKIATEIIERANIGAVEIIDDSGYARELILSSGDIEEMTLIDKKTKREIELTKDPKLYEPLIRKVLDTYKIGITGKSVISVHVKVKNDDRYHMYGSYEEGNVPKEVYMLFNAVK